MTTEPTTALAVVPAMPNWMRSEVEPYIGKGYELLLPDVPVNSELGFGNVVQISTVQLSADPAAGDIYKVGWKPGAGDVFAYSKTALEKLANAAGINISTRRIDDGSNRDYCEVKATAAMRNSSGQWVIREALKAFHMVDVAAEAWATRVKRNATAKPDQKRSDAQMQQEHEAEMSSFRRHLLARVESGASNRAIRKLLAVRSGLTAAEVAKPKVIARIDFRPDTSDPDVKRAVIDQGMRSAHEMFSGPAPREIGPRVRQVEAREEIEPDDEETQRARLVRSGAVQVEQAPAAAPAPAAIAGAPTERDYLGEIAMGAEILGLTHAERNALIFEHKGDLRAAYDDINRRVAARQAREGA